MIKLGQAYLLLSDGADSRSLIGELLPQYQLSFELIGVQDARTIRATQNLRSTPGGSILMIRAGGITPEAQNALLKVTEDIRAESAIVFLLPRSLELLPTFRSRLVNLTGLSGKDGKHPLSLQALHFLELSPKERLSYTREVEVADFLDALEEVCYTHSPGSLGSIVFTKKQLRLGAVSIRMALDHVSYIIPKLDSHAKIRV